MTDPGRGEFERAAEERRRGVVSELLEFMRANKKWWLLPLLTVLLLMGVLIALSSSPIAPFIYTLF